ncbi:hypothetical protein BC829DRAFT_407141 [Chytridium lagenaria]|nr:hypothetical protein BC829DRAFT_407141 [Chytridium lagenaria]
MTCPDENPLAPPTDSELWSYGWVLSGFFALFAVTTSTTLMTLHLRHWTRPHLCFFSLCLVYLEVSAEYIPELGPVDFRPHVLFSLQSWRYHFLFLCKLGIIQLTLSRIATSTFTLITEADRLSKGIF